jgi:lipopolysaccharide export system protein LptA
VFLLFWLLATLAMGVAATTPASSNASEQEQADWLSALAFSGSDEPVFLKADRLEFQYDNRLLVYQGNVEIRQGQTIVRAAEVRVHLSQGDRMEIQQVHASGNVRISQGERWATAREALFDQTKRTAILRGEAVLHDGRNEVKGDTVTVYLDQKRSVVEGGNGRVQAVFYPSTGSVPPTP